MSYLAQVQRGIDFIEERLDQDIETSDVARCAGISHWHFQRIFKALTNETLKTYIRSRRLAAVLPKLEDTDERIIEIALAAGFETQESFTRAFRKAFGITPALHRKKRRRFPFPNKVRFDAEYLAHIHQSVSLDPVFEDRPSARVVGVRTRFFGVDSEKNNMAEKIPALWAAFMPRAAEVRGAVPGPWYGVIRQTEDKTDELEYLAGRVVHEGGEPPPGMDEVHVPAARYARFDHRGKLDGLDRTVSYIYSSWLARSGLRHTYGPDLEIYGAEYVPDSDESLIRYAIPVAPT